jgi:hypothetical protein
MTTLRRGFKTWCENASRGYRRELKLAPVAPLDPWLLATHLGITVWTPGDIPGLSLKDVHHLTVVAGETWSAATLRDGSESLIIVNSGHARTRQNNSIAHEIAHIVLEHKPAQMFLRDDGLMMMSEYNLEHEQEAGWFAGAILLPRDALLHASAQGMTAQAAAAHFGVSLVLYQMRRNRTGDDIQLSRRRGVWAP